MSSNKENKLSQIKQKIQQGPKSDISTEFYFLAKELGCLGELLGREFVFTYEKGKIIGFKQLPIPISSFINLMTEMDKDYKNQEKQAKKGKRK